MTVERPAGRPGDETDLASHFAFGKNWRSFVETVNEDSIAMAVQSLTRLLPAEQLRGRQFLDIGCGSGLTMLAAMRLGAGAVQGVDIDPNSVAAADALLTRFVPGGAWSVKVASVFDLPQQSGGTFDIVHSWGVLHHTGNMTEAIRRAAALVAPGGHFIIALYRKTPLCRLWKVEKRLYSAAPRPIQATMRGVYYSAYCAGLLATGRSPQEYIRTYKSARGMDWAHDVHDWLGGYPYESITPAEATAQLRSLGFDLVRAYEKPAPLGGLFGSHCDEFIAVRRA
jgi:2-polyprenyl-6-hydroxyphenyl methylase/3-demethylubiquinone-9 3-methyltransferase